MDNQRLFLYASLAVVLFLIWQTWQQEHTPKPLPSAQKTEQKMGSTPETAKTLSELQDIPESTESPVQTTPKSMAHEKRIRVVTDVLAVEISTIGGDIVQADLPTYPVSIEALNQPFRLLSHSQDHLYIAQSGLVHDKVGQDNKEIGLLAPTHHAEYDAENTNYRLADGADQLKVPLVWKGLNGVTVKKIFTFHRKKYLVEVEHVVINEGNNVWTGRQYQQLRHGAIKSDGTSRFTRTPTYTGGAYYDGKFEKVTFEDMAEQPLNKELIGGWVAMLQHYFVSAWVPKPADHDMLYTKVVNSDSSPEYIIGLRSESKAIASGETTSFHTQIYVGPKLQDHLGEISKGLDLVTNYGIFTVISKPLFWLLKWFHSWLGNWGWAIIVLTVLIKLAFYKLSETSYRSMAKMRSVQPRLAAIKERYGTDKQRMNQALMDLYKKEKINPLGGCLPIVIQIPVFIALYWVLLESVELRQAPFIFWIHDLSTKDPFFVLPVLMGITMFVQQKLNPAPIDPMQAKVMMALPLVFTVFFAFFPSGLVLYWFTNNLLSITQQWVITRRIEKAAAKI